MAPNRPVAIRPARDDDAEGLIALIDSCYREYPGLVLDVDAEEPHLRAIASYVREAGGRFWVAECEGDVVGSGGAMPRGEGTVELIKLYVRRAHRGEGLARRIIDGVVQFARERGAGQVTLWSDTRFDRAHRLYRFVGFEQCEETRRLNDISESVEFRFCRKLGDVAS